MWLIGFTCGHWGADVAPIGSWPTSDAGEVGNSDQKLSGEAESLGKHVDVPLPV